MACARALFAALPAVFFFGGGRRVSTRVQDLSLLPLSLGELTVNRLVILIPGLGVHVFPCMCPGRPPKEKWLRLRKKQRKRSTRPFNPYNLSPHLEALKNGS